MIESLGPGVAVFDDDLKQRQAVEDDPRVLEVLERLLARSAPSSKAPPEIDAARGAPGLWALSASRP